MYEERLKCIKDTLLCAVETQTAHLESVNAKELGEAIDMIKDLEEAIYYHTITKAMHQSDTHERDMDRVNGKMYYPWQSTTHYPRDGMMHRDGETVAQDTWEEYDLREGKSHKNRRMYMEAKEMHQDKATQLRELEKYMQELSQDVIDMITDASLEEKQYLEKKLTTLASKVAQMK